MSLTKQGGGNAEKIKDGSRKTKKGRKIKKRVKKNKNP